jgi:hypothetical protein
MLSICTCAISVPKTDADGLGQTFRLAEKHAPHAITHEETNPPDGSGSQTDETYKPNSLAIVFKKRNWGLSVEFPVSLIMSGGA